MAAPAKHVSIMGRGSLVARHLIALTNFTDVGVYLIGRSMLAANPPRRQTLMNSKRQLPSPHKPRLGPNAKPSNCISCEVNGKGASPDRSPQGYPAMITLFPSY